MYVHKTVHIYILLLIKRGGILRSFTLSHKSDDRNKKKKKKKKIREERVLKFGLDTQNVRSPANRAVESVQRFQGVEVSIEADLQVFASKRDARSTAMLLVHHIQSDLDI